MNEDEPVLYGWYSNLVPDGTQFVYYAKYWNTVGWYPFTIYIGYCKNFKDANVFKRKFEEQHVSWSDLSYIDPRYGVDTEARALFNYVQRDWSLTSVEPDVRLWDPSKAKFVKKEIIVKFKG